MADKPNSENEPITIKKYANRRLYNTETSSYVTLDHLARMVKEGKNFVVRDAKSGNDITRTVLTHIIVEEESKGQNLLPITFLRHLISFYGDSLQSLVPQYLDYSMQSFARNQEQMRDYMSSTVGDASPLGQFEEMGKQNMAIFENAVNMLSSMYGGATNGPAAATADPPAGTGGKGDQMEELKAKIDQMQKQLDRLTGGGR
jgi:polyhydroxyalkanoate synthesis repressor PhaR